MSGRKNRRGFLKGAAGIAGGAALVRGQEPAAPGGGAAPPPKKAKITSSVMLWTLKGTFEQRLATAADAGIQSTELVTEYSEWSAQEAERYKRIVASYGMHMDLLLGSKDWTRRPVTMVNPDHRDGFLADLKNAIEWAKKLDIGQIIAMSGNEQPGMTHEAQYASLVESGKRAAELAEAADVTVVLENLNSKVNHPGYFLTSAAEALKAVKEVNHPRFRFLFDLYHEAVQNGDPLPVMKDAYPYVNVFHVADAPGRHDPGTGQMKWAELYKDIDKSGYAGYVAMEYLPTPEDQVSSLMKAVTEMRRGVNGAGDATGKETSG